MSRQAVVFIVDDEETIRDGLADLVVGMGYEAQTFASAEEFLQGHAPERLGCVILDVRMPGMNGLELQERLVEQGSLLPIIFITGHGDVGMCVQSLRMGAVDFVEKPFREQALWESIKKAMAQAVELKRGQAEQEILTEKFSRLSPREREVMDILVGGKTDKQVALELGITVRAVAFHRMHILEKMEVNSVVELARLLPK